MNNVGGFSTTPNATSNIPTTTPTPYVEQNILSPSVTGYTPPVPTTNQ